MFLNIIAKIVLISNLILLIVIVIHVVFFQFVWVIIIKLAIDFIIIAICDLNLESIATCDLNLELIISFMISNSKFDHLWIPIQIWVIISTVLNQKQLVNFKEVVIRVVNLLILKFLNISYSIINSHFTVNQSLLASLKPHL